MMIDAFLEWSERAPRDRRIEAADALARSYLYSKLSDDDRRKVLTGLFALVDDPSFAVRERLSSVFADRRDAPRVIVLKLLDDVPAVSAPLFARSPLLHDSHLVDALHRGEARLEDAIAGRIDLSDRLVALLLAQGCVSACKQLVSNPYVVLGDKDLHAYIERFRGDGAALDALQANRRLSPEHVCRLIVARAEAQRSNDFVRALVPDKRLQRLTNSACERAVLDVMAHLDGPACWQVSGTLHQGGIITPAFLLRVALSGHILTLEAMVARLCDVSMERVRSAFVHSRPLVAATLLKKTGLSTDVRDILSMALVLAREFARSDIDWTERFFAETLIEVIDQRSADQPFGDDGSLGDATVALCHSIAADIIQADARAQKKANQAPNLGDLDAMFAETLREAPMSIDAEALILDALGDDDGRVLLSDTRALAA